MPGPDSVVPVCVKPSSSPENAHADVPPSLIGVGSPLPLTSPANTEPALTPKTDAAQIATPATVF
jgi:hypothetical protein